MQIGDRAFYIIGPDDIPILKVQRAQKATDGSSINVGNLPDVGDRFMMFVTAMPVAQNEAKCNGQVFLDGNDHLWVTNVTEAPEPGHFVLDIDYYRGEVIP